MALHCSTFAWKIPWTEEPSRLQSMGSQRVWHDPTTSLSLFYFHALEKEMATHSSVLAWRIPGTVEPGGLPSMGSHRVGHNWSDLAATISHVSSITTQETLNLKALPSSWSKKLLGPVLAFSSYQEQQVHLYMLSSLSIHGGLVPGHSQPSADSKLCRCFKYFIYNDEVELAFQICR